MDRRRVRLDSRMEDVRPAAAPVQRFVQGPAPQPNEGANQLLQALEAWHRPLHNLMLQQIARDREAQEAEAARLRETMTADEMRLAMEKGTLEHWRNPRFREAFSRQTGQKLAFQWARELEELRAREGLVIGDNFDEWLAEQLRERLEPFEGNTAFLQGVSQVLPQFTESLRSQHSRQLTGEIQDQVRDNLKSNMIETIRLGLQQEVPPQEIHRKLREGFRDNKEFLALPYQEQNAILLDVAGFFATQGEVELVEEILDGQREGIGPLGKTKQGLAVRERILNAARAARLENDHERWSADRVNFAMEAEAVEGTYEDFHQRLTDWYFDPRNKGAMRQEKYEQLLAKYRANLERKNAEAEQVRISAFNRAAKESAILELFEEAEARGIDFAAREVAWQDYHGDTHYVAPQEVAGFLATFMDRLATQQMEAIRAAGLPPEQLAEMEDLYIGRLAQIYSGYAGTREEWRRSFSIVGQAATFEDWSSGEVRKDIVEAAELYRRIHQNSPMLARRHAGDSSQLLDAYLSQRVWHGLDPERALANAQRVTELRKNETDLDREERYRTLAQEVKRLADKGNSWWDVFASRAENTASIYQRLNSMAQELNDLGWPHDKAVEEAAKRLMERSTIANGWWVPLQHGSPDNVGDLFDIWLEEAGADAALETLSSVEDLTLAPTESPYHFILVDKQTISPIRVLSYEEISDVARERFKHEQEKRDRAAAERLQQRWQHRNRRDIGYPVTPYAVTPHAP